MYLIYNGLFFVENVKNFYQYKCKNNKDFLQKLKQILKTSYNGDNIKVKKR